MIDFLYNTATFEVKKVNLLKNGVEFFPNGPDIVIEDKKNKIRHLFELSVPLARSIKIQNTEKSNRYAHFLKI